MEVKETRRPSFPQGGFESHKTRQERLARAERRRTIPVCQLPESDEDEDESDEGDSDEEDEDVLAERYVGDTCPYRRPSKRPKYGAQHCRGCPLFSTNKRQHQTIVSARRNEEHIYPGGSRLDEEQGVDDIATCSSPNLLQPPPLITPSNSSRSPVSRCRCGLFRNGNVSNSSHLRNNNYKKGRHHDKEKVGLGSKEKITTLCATDNSGIFTEDGKSPAKRGDTSILWEDEKGTQADSVDGNGGNDDGEGGGDKDDAMSHQEPPAYKHDLPRRSILHVNNNSIKKPKRKRRSRETVILNVGGQTFETYRSTLRRLRTPIFDSDAALQRYFRRSHGDFFFDRDATAFSSVLNFLRTGELHIPTNMCGPALQSELEFWGIEEVDIARCCWTQYNTWKTQCRSLEKLEYDRKFSTTQQNNDVDSNASSWAKFRARVWTLLQDPSSSKLAKVYAWVSIIFVFVSIFSFCAETHPLFKVKARDMTHLATLYQFFNVEHIQFGDIDVTGSGNNQTNSSFENTGDSNIQGFKPILNVSSIYNTNTSNNQVTTTSATITSSSNTVKSVTDQSDENVDNEDDTMCKEDDYEPIRRGGSGIGGGMRIRLEESKCAGKRKDTAKEKDWGDRDLPHPALLIIDVCCLAFFTLEYLTRFTCSPNKMNFLRALQNIVDFLAFAPDYVEIMFLMVGPGNGKEGVAVMEMLFILRILRLFRIFRLIRHVPGLWILLYTLKASFNELMLMCVFLLIGMVVFATLIHFAEPEGIFTNIPVGFWWAVVTMTTVGYGDMYPQSPAGYFIGSCCAVAGLLMIAFTVPIIVSNFVLYYTHVQYGLARKDREMEKLLEEEIEEELDALERSRSHVNVAVGAGGEGTRVISKGNKHKKDQLDDNLGSMKSINSKVTSLESPLPDKRQDQSSPHRFSLMSAISLSPLQKVTRPSSSRESVASSKASSSAVTLPPPPSLSNNSKPWISPASLKLSSTASANPLTSPTKTAQPKTTVRNGKCYIGVTSKSDTDLSPSRSLLQKALIKTPPLPKKEASEGEARQAKKGQRGYKVKDTSLGSIGLSERRKDYRDDRRGSCTVVLLHDDNPSA
ncbi:potassium voltage-gated channel protein Shaw [Elysia marginata]|uniref:Potassium voltage-gated channel protein Shaw n=1 Tax=Elysia marginata TaxID=1093978 RepID=A0AAV4FRX2_9GAST|nr:potassium voltage-gated channel protein Shaw [Elysia marginata]